MGTRSLTFIIDEAHGSNEKLVCMYRQFDGYPTGHGAELADFLSGFNITNGIAADAKFGKSANGAGCLAAQMIAHFKDGVGGIYINSIEDDGSFVDYVYSVYVTEDMEIEVSVGEDSSYANVFSRNKLSKYHQFIEKEQNDS